ncbi:hypothetical protein COEREDRAFT_85963 [Coemansia reversa NRRL 1564]|uniref:Uncharacterized protein n=1 Tax=Coemansia reversa (strain ATCC 12441 / NRRL 1564) TaxID=763665 RepID=A0A2G5BFA9_COERN|nr:hypothetical protein COEREDRAFT_85963 [Coemansia reversa NRRL 1564]|eukprot:PIA17695.1 hypothetical protein COEREDRAFT_85963 [Coemansia reversa NRRL 1564]
MSDENRPKTYKETAGYLENKARVDAFLEFERVDLERCTFTDRTVGDKIKLQYDNDNWLLIFHHPEPDVCIMDSEEMKNIWYCGNDGVFIEKQMDGIKTRLKDLFARQNNDETVNNPEASMEGQGFLSPKLRRFLMALYKK